MVKFSPFRLREFVLLSFQDLLKYLPSRMLMFKMTSGQHDRGRLDTPDSMVSGMADGLRTEMFQLRDNLTDNDQCCRYSAALPLQCCTAVTGLHCCYGAALPLQCCTAITVLHCRYGDALPLQCCTAVMVLHCRYSDALPLRCCTVVTVLHCRYGAALPLQFLVRWR